MIQLSEALMRVIEDHAEVTYPEECCGVLLGVSHEGNHEVREILEIDNSQDKNRRRRFLISPEQYRDAERAAAGRQLELLGFYHSHPDHPAIPSQFDTDHALPWFTYVIVAVEGGHAVAFTAWLLQQDRKQFEVRPVSVTALSGDKIVVE
jgi:proteasome lid subunit RPN8/RPN11